MRRTFRVVPNGATVGLDNLMTGQTILRGVKPEALVTIDGVRYEVGGLTGQPDYAYLLPEWLEQMKADPDAFRFVGFHVGRPAERFAWKRVRHHAPEATWPPEGVYLRMDYEAPAGSPLSPDEPQSGDNARTGPIVDAAKTDRAKGVRVSVHYELYDGVPVMSKWITVHNPTDEEDHRRPLHQRDAGGRRAQQLGGETRGRALAAAGRRCTSRRTWPSADFSRPTPTVTSFTGGRDPQFQTQVNYLRETPCLLVVEPTYGPAQDVEPGGTFESFRAFELVHDATDRERRGLALRRMYRTIAPWVTENPLMMHMRTADPAAVRSAIDQCAEVGFEMLILSFGSGFNIENDSPEYVTLVQGAGRLRPAERYRDRRLLAAGLPKRRRRQRRGLAARHVPDLRQLPRADVRVGPGLLPQALRVLRQDRLHAAGTRRFLSRATWT